MPKPDNKLLSDFFLGGSQITSDKNEVIYSSDATRASVFFVKKGFIKSYTIDALGELNILSFYGPNSIFPLAPILHDSKGHNVFHYTGAVFFESMTDIQVYKRGASEFMDFVDSHPSIYKELAEHLIHNYEIYLSRSESLQFRHARERIVYQLLVLGNRFGDRQSCPTTIQVPLTHQDLSDSLSMARETVTRELEYLRSENYIQSEGKFITLNDTDKLYDILGMLNAPRYNL